MTRRPLYYVLKGKLVIPTEDLLEWATMLEGPERIVKQDRVGQLWVSTVFMGLDHSFSLDPAAEPIVFETMVFDDLDKGMREQYQHRCSTWDEAIEMHAAGCDWAREHQPEVKQPKEQEQ